MQNTAVTPVDHPGKSRQFDRTVIHNAKNLIVVYGNPGKPAVTADWWLVAECLMLAVYALAATIWIALS